ncbi:unnamed protein product [Phaedon cochleariae]|uniref:Uncharacterized protein n=1 Tax=Phaedon cochleariae TaxID=80249 RepID=A0A9N9SF28_PHACE|nr:unnamed protein product [Phaedon cochleariae]
MMTRSKSVKPRSKTASYLVLDEIRTEDVENITGTSSQNENRCPDRKSKKSSATKASSVRRRELEAQIKAVEEMAQLLAKEEDIIARRKQVSQRLLENRLSLERVCEEEDSKEGSQDGCSSLSADATFKKVSSWLNTHEEERKIRVQEEHRGSDLPIQDITHLLARQNIDKDLPIFSGNIREWPSFYNQYISTTKVLGSSDDENLCRLRKCLKGDARRAVEGLLLSSLSIQSVIQILQNRFGRPDLIVRSLVQDPKQLAIVRNGDFKGLIHFSETIAN